MSDSTFEEVKILNISYRTYDDFRPDLKINKNIVDINDVQNEPIHVHIPHGHFILMYDNSSIPQPQFLHWLKSCEDEYYPYIPPKPPANTGMHTYIFVLFRGEIPFIPKQRDYFSPFLFFNLCEVKEANWMSVDSYQIISNHQITK